MTELGEAASIAIGFSYKAAVGDGRELVLQSAVPFEAGVGALHKALDMMRAGADRQIIYGKLESFDNEIELKERLVGQLEEGIANVDAIVQQRKELSGRRQGLTTQEETQRSQAVTNLKNEKTSIERMKAKREALRASLKE